MAKSKKHPKKRTGQKKHYTTEKSSASNVTKKEITSASDEHGMFSPLYIRTNTTITRLLKRIYDEDNNKDVRYKALFCDELTRRPVSLTVFLSNGPYDYLVLKYSIKHDMGRESLRVNLLEREENFLNRYVKPSDVSDKLANKTASLVGPAIVSKQLDRLKFEGYRYIVYCKETSGEEFVMQKRGVNE